MITSNCKKMQNNKITTEHFLKSYRINNRIPSIYGDFLLYKNFRNLRRRKKIKWYIQQQLHV